MTLPRQPTLPGLPLESAGTGAGVQNGGRSRTPFGGTSLQAPQARLARWASRSGTTVEWGNVVAGATGQSFRETFATEGEAIERQRQALAGEEIGENRAPLALVRHRLGRWGGVTATTHPRAACATQ